MHSFRLVCQGAGYPSIDTFCVLFGFKQSVWMGSILDLKSGYQSVWHGMIALFFSLLLLLAAVKSLHQNFLSAFTFFLLLY